MDIKALLRELELRPRKRLGQSFLSDRQVLQQILRASEIAADDSVLEIGAGLGILTQALAERARRVVAVEVDEELVAVLRARWDSLPNVNVVLGDILELDIATLMREGGTPEAPPYKVVANIPYYITSAVLRHILEASARPRLVVLMVQYEVAQRIVAVPGQMSLLAVSVQFYGLPRLVRRVPARAFYPIPKVDSAIVRIDPHRHLPVEDSEVEAFFMVVRAGFAQRRKQLRNALVHGLSLPREIVSQAMSRAGIEERRRAQSLSLADWVALCRALNAEPGWRNREEA